VQTVVIDERRLQSIDKKITNYLSALCGKHPRRFCAPSLDRIRFAAAWGMADEFIEERLAHLVAIGRIDRAKEEVNGEAIDGFRVLPNRLFQHAAGAVALDNLDLTVEDIDFLRSCGIAVPAEHVAPER
jgi:hypothetical protein